jgi:uncharacterized protein (DUF362 family)
MSVSIIKVEDYNKLLEYIRKLLEPLPHEFSGKRVFIKPNIVVPAKPNTGIVVDPRVVGAFIDFLREQNVKEIMVGEGPGLGVRTEEAFEVSGFTQLAKEKNVQLIDLNKVERVEVPWRYGKISVPKVVLNSYYVNICKIKTHIQTTVSLAIKNQKGLILPSDKKRFHQLGLHEPLARFLEVIKPQLILVDGIIAIEGDGPLFSGRKKKLNLLLAGDDIVAVDAICCKIMGIDPSLVRHIQLASEIGMGTLKPKIYGVTLEEVKTSFQRANEEHWHFMRIYNWRNPYACSMCVDSIRDALKIAKKKPKYWITIWPKIIVYATVKGLNFVTGRNAKIPPRRGHVICLGECTKDFAKKYGFCFVSGCPPKPEDILSALEGSAERTSCPP